MANDSTTKALLWVPRYWPAMGGTELHTRELANVLSSDHNVQVVTHCNSSENSVSTLEFDANNSTDTMYVDGPVTVNKISANYLAKPILRLLANQHRRFKLVRLFYSAAFSVSLYKRSMALSEKSDIIHFVYNGLTDSAMLASFIAKRQGIPFVFTPNILDTSDTNHAWNSRRFHFLYKSASRIIALTPHEAEWLVSQNISRDKISIVPYGPILQDKPDADRFRQTINVSDENIILFLSRIIPLKGYKLVLDACQDIWAEHPETRVVFMGPTTPESKESILEPGDSRITLLEDFDQNTKADALAACSLLCVPSRKESLGVVYIEAAFNAKPVVALNLPVLHGVIGHGKDGLLVDESSSCVAEAINSLLRDPERAEMMGQSGRIKAIQKFSWTSVKTQISEIYRDVIAEHNNRPSKPS